MRSMSGQRSAARQSTQRRRDVAAALRRNGLETIIGLDLDNSGDGATVTPWPASVQKNHCDEHREVSAETVCQERNARALVAIVEDLTSSTVAANIK